MTNVLRRLPFPLTLINDPELGFLEEIGEDTFDLSINHKTARGLTPVGNRALSRIEAVLYLRPPHTTGPGAG